MKAIHAKKNLKAISNKIRVSIGTEGGKNLDYVKGAGEL